MIRPKGSKLRNIESIEEEPEIEQLIEEPTDEDVRKYAGVDVSANQLTRQLLAAYGPKGMQQALSRIYGFTQTVPVIDEFIDDQKWLGKIVGPDIYPIWRNALYQIFPNPFYSPYVEVINTGAIGTGKTTIAIVGALYDLMRLVLLDNPQKRFKLMSTTKIAYAIMNATLTLAGNVIYDQMYQMIISSSILDEFVNKNRVKGQTLLKNNIDIIIGSRASHALGMAIIGAILDEINFQSKVADQAYDNYKGIKRRIQSRFMTTTGSYFARVWMVSSKNDKLDFLDKHIAKNRGKAHVKVYDFPMWTALRHKFEFCGKTFKVFVGNDHRDPCILEKRTDFHGLPDERIIDVPTELYEDFVYDINASLKDLAGISMSSAFKYIPSAEMIKRALAIPNPVFREEIRLDFWDKSDVLMDYVDLKHLRIPQFIDHPRYIHIDMGLSQDRLGISSTLIHDVVHLKKKDPWTGKVLDLMEPQFLTEFSIAIKAKTSSQIPIYKIKDFIFQLLKMGYPIAKVTLDGFQSQNLKQDLLLLGIDASIQSVDKTKDPYDCLKTAYLQGRILSPKMDILKNELVDLIDIGKKIDHPADGSKDVSDSQAGSVYTAYLDYQKFPTIKEMIEHNKYRVVGEESDVYDRTRTR